MDISEVSTLSADAPNDDFLPEMVEVDKRHPTEAGESVPPKVVKAWRDEPPNDTEGPEALRNCKQVHLKCQCGLVYHVRHRKKSKRYSLALNPDQNEVCEFPCFLGDRDSVDSLQEENPAGLNLKRPVGGIGLLLNNSKNPKMGQAESSVVTGSAGSRGIPTTRYKGALSVLWSLMEKARLNRFQPGVERGITEQWQAMFEAAAETKIDKTSLSLGNLMWFPLPRYFHDKRVTLKSQILKKWNVTDNVPEGYAVISLDTFPTSTRVSTKCCDPEAYAERQLAGIKSPNYHAELSRRRMARVGRTGPYLGMLIGHVKNDISDAFPMTMLQFVAQAVLSPQSLLPVESSEERLAAQVLISRNLAFHKPVFSLDGERPDFILEEDKIVLEVQGMTLNSYMEAKAKRLPVIKKWAEEHGWRLVPWNPNVGETPGKLHELLDEALGIISTNKPET